MPRKNKKDENAPYLPPLIVNGCPGAGYYLCVYKNQWDSDYGRSKRVSATSVGRVQGVDKFGLCLFYEAFLEKYPELRDYEIYRTEGPQRYVFIPKPKDMAAKGENEVPTLKHSTINQLAARAALLLSENETE